ncbi:hypothetical protein CH063_08412 [Colletotrichum higginsianum]|uniref:Uncharacterized protein n=2 Tax=Colletotrichum higginsianum TaxID=80884 RepID=H1V9S0_COLHI|nr:hypothetical protein CH63R_09513 [Colletotrichum higginsianum IMI 349063]OBR07992.1 hypothetical protein CH63R_09513 [Colletotrichum higginsianum IMI 349063]TIC91552.1 hypothetical protein CH35J_010883 [Colletotrichum higginsianum]CCF36973.1 hypothetical protein CH063_08412 [Colletotrichum higginsianum]
MLIFRFALYTFLQALALTQIYALPSDNPQPRINKREEVDLQGQRLPWFGEVVTLYIVCYKENWHPAIIAIASDGSSYRWHAENWAFAPRNDWELSAQKRFPYDNNFVKTLSKKVVRKIGEVKWRSLDHVLGQKSLLPSNDGRLKENCWWWAQRAMKKLVQGNYLDEETAHKAYTGIKRSTAWRGRPWRAPRWRDKV